MPKGNKRSVTESILMWISLATGLGVLPFAVYRFSLQQWDIAIMDISVSAIMLSLFFYIYKTQNVRIAAKILISMALIGSLLSIYLKGPQQIYWVFPATVATFYVLKPNFSAAITFVFSLALTLMLYHHTSSLQLLTVLMTLLITNLLAYVFSTSMARQREQLLLLATQDPLTGAGNRRALKDKMKHIIASNLRAPSNVSLLLIDLDYFKKINDKFGHNAGDVFLTELTRLIHSRIRTTDTLFRFGGEEFIVIAENTNIDAAKVLSEVLRTTTESSDIVPETIVTISIGVAVLHKDETDEQWIKRADDALFQAKENGRNQVCLADTSRVNEDKPLKTVLI